MDEEVEAQLRFIERGLVLLMAQYAEKARRVQELERRLAGIRRLVEDFRLEPGSSQPRGRQETREERG